MELTLTMQEFNSVLNTSNEENVLITALRRLMAIEKPEDLAVMARGPAAVTWQGWG